MASYNKERYEFIERMFAGLDGISPERVISRFMPLTRMGRHFMGLCPFHRDTKLGSFMVTPDKGIWKCFTCGDGYAGNAVKFVSLFKNQSYLDAAFDVALSTGVISNLDYEKYSKKKYDEDYVRKLEKRYSDKANNEPKPEKTKPEIIHNVYLMMKKMCPLSEEHRKSLKEYRKLSDDRIEKDYFTCPVNWRQINAIIDAVKKKYPQITDAELQKVPGFFYDKAKKKIRFSGYKGLCLLIRDADGVIRGIQIRRDNAKEGESRYVWISSTFAFYKEEYSGGCGCGSPKDVIWPAKDAAKSRNTLCITEGKFKAEVLAQNGNTSISMQGVSAWKGVNDTIRKVLAKQGSIDKVYIFLDADILGKYMLFKQSKEMCASIAGEFGMRIKYAFWNKAAGKGIDDYINASGNTKEISYIDWSKAAEVADKVFDYMLKKYGVSRLQELKQEDVEPFEKDMQAELEMRFVKKTA